MTSLNSENALLIKPPLGALASLPGALSVPPSDRFAAPDDEGAPEPGAPSAGEAPGPPMSDSLSPGFGLRPAMPPPGGPPVPVVPLRLIGGPPPGNPPALRAASPPIPGPEDGGKARAPPPKLGVPEGPPRARSCDGSIL